MQASLWLGLVVFAFLRTAVPAAAQAPVGALAIDERQGEQWGWAVDYETAAAAQERALRECGSGCSVVLTFDRCGAFAADQDADAKRVDGRDRPCVVNAFRAERGPLATSRLRTVSTDRREPRRIRTTWLDQMVGSPFQLAISNAWSKRRYGAHPSRTSTPSNSASRTLTASSNPRPGQMA